MKRNIFAGKRIEGILGACLLFIFLTGCGEVPLQEGINLQLEKDGGVTVTYIKDFPSDYYDIAELEAMNQEEIDAYNQKVGDDVVEVISTETDGSKITMKMRYEDVEDYGDMNGVQVFSGTVGQAIAMGYDLNRTFTNIKDGEKTTEINWEDLESHHIMITNELSAVHTYKKIEYVTEDVEVSDDKKMATVTGEGQAVIVFK